MTTSAASQPDRTMREVTLIDADVHHTPDHQAVLKRMPAALAKRGWQNPGGFGVTNPHSVSRPDARPPGGGAPGSDPDFMLEHHFDRFGVDYGVLHPGGTLALGVSVDYRYAAEACRAYNDYMLETWLEHSDRFLGALLVASQWPEQAAAEIRRVGAQGRLVQVIMASATQMPLGNVNYWPIFEAAEEMGLPVAVHPGSEGRGISGPPTAAGWPSRYFEWHTGLSQSYMAHVASLVLEAVFQKFPGLTFVAVEGGVAWLPHLMWRLDKNWKALRETTPWLVETPSAVIRRHVKLTTQPIEEPERPEHLLQIFEMIGSDEMLMFSSDYPHWDNDSPTHGLPRMDEALRRKIMCENARTLYRLPRERPAEA